MTGAGTASRTGSNWWTEPASTVMRRSLRLHETLDLVLAKETLEQAPVALLVAEDRDHHVVGHRVDVLGELDDPVVVLDGAGLGLDHALDDVHDVGLLVGRLQEGLLGGEFQPSRCSARSSERMPSEEWRTDRGETPCSVSGETGAPLRGRAHETALVCGDAALVLLLRRRPAGER